LKGVVHDVLYIEPNPVEVPVPEFGHFVFRQFLGLFRFGRCGKFELLFEIFLCCDTPSNIIGKIDLQAVFFDGGRDDMHMLVFGIVMADNDIGLFAIAYLFHITFGEFKKFPVAQVLATGKVQGGVQISLF
jgi:hypothetical protein